MTVLRTTMAVAVVVTLGLLAATPIIASEDLTRARDLYRAAAYEDALKVLNGMTVEPTEGEEVSLYRVLCLIALDRLDDAKQAMGALVETSPLYRLPENETSPRVRAMFGEVRKSVLPRVAQRAYADARAAFDRKDAGATERFDRVLVLLRDPDLAADPALADLATVVVGFRDLSKASTSPPVAGAAPPAPARPAPASAAVVVPPVAISQAFPTFQLREAREWDGEVEVIIDPAGKVVSARMTKSIHPQYDVVLLRAAKGWTYRPATKDGVPTQMLKLVSVHLDSRPACGPRVRVACRPVTQ
jgi:hypothetical protein